MKTRGKYEETPAAASSRYEKMKKRTLLQSYLLSLVSLCLCATMLMGTTMAWFTSEVTSSENELYVGTLEVDLLLDDLSLKDAGAPKVFGDDITWAPDHLEVRTLTVVDEGQIPFKYELGLSAGGCYSDDEQEVTDPAMLARFWKQFSVYVKEGEAESNVMPIDLTELNGWTCVGTLDQIYGGNQVFKGESGKMADKKATYSVAVHMDSNANGEFQGYTLKFNIKLVANQAGMPETVTTQDELEALLASDSKVSVHLASGEFTMPSVSGKNVTITGTVAAKLVLPYGDISANGSVITIEGVSVMGESNDSWYSTLFNGATKVIFKNCEIYDQLTTYSNTDFINCNFHNGFDNDYSVYCYSGSTIKFDNCSFTSKCSKAIKVYDEGNGGRSVYVNNCSFTTETANKAAVEIDSTFSEYHIYFTGTNTLSGAYTKLWNSDAGEDMGTNVYIDGVKQ